jgi:hypothetical protein
MMMMMIMMMIMMTMNVTDPNDDIISRLQTDDAALWCHLVCEGLEELGLLERGQQALLVAQLQHQVLPLLPHRGSSIAVNIIIDIITSSSSSSSIIIIIITLTITIVNDVTHQHDIQHEQPQQSQHYDDPADPIRGSVLVNR